MISNLSLCVIPDEIDLLEAATEKLNGISDAEMQSILEVRSNVLKG
jgi:hypothetical protein